VSSLDSALRAHASLAARRAASTDDDAFAFAFDAFFDVDPSSSSSNAGGPALGSISINRTSDGHARATAIRSLAHAFASVGRGRSLAGLYSRLFFSGADASTREISLVLASAFSLSF
jgi:hypothetical protein